jgi:pimeloyl-ACP methyl ester carboxylesterase
MPRFYNHAMRLRWVLVMVVVLPVVLSAQQPALSGQTREAVTSRLAELRRIHTPNGIEVLEEVPFGDTRQWVSIRGKDRRNPILLFIHGGPGTPMLPMAWAYQTPWEDFFTVVQWDQRGVGKNAVTADREALTPTLSAAQVLDDAEAVTAWVRTRLQADKVIVMGYSYGTMIGMALAQRRPEWVHAYVGTGQMAPGTNSEAVIYDRLLQLAGIDGNSQALTELRTIAPYPREGQTPADMLVVRRWARRYNGGWYGKPDFDLLFSLPEWAPEYTEVDLAAQQAASQWFSRTVMRNPHGREPEEWLTIPVPVVVIQGRHDLHTPYESAKAFVERVKAPTVRFITLEHAAHVPMLEEPGRFLLALIQEVLPLAGQGR